jgi:hypothetical protein
MRSKRIHAQLGIIAAGVVLIASLAVLALSSVTTDSPPVRQPTASINSAPLAPMDISSGNSHQH